MTDSFLVIRPSHDLTVFYLSVWANQIIQEAKNKGIPVIDCRDENATKDNVQKIIEKQKPVLIFINGHGSHDSVSGHKNQVLFQAGENHQWLSNKMVYALSCKSAQMLGSIATQNGNGAYVGYEQDFIFVVDTTHTANPINDPIAKNFLDPSNELVRALLKGNTAQEAANHSRSAMLKNIRKLLASNTTPGNATAARYLFWNWRHQAVKGNAEATVPFA